VGRRTWPGRGDIHAPCPCVCASSFLLVILRRAASNPKWAPATFCSPHGTVAAAARQRQERARERHHRRLHALSWLLQLRRRLRDQPTRPVKPAGGLGARCVPVARPHVLGKQRRPPRLPLPAQLLPRPPGRRGGLQLHALHARRLLLQQLALQLQRRAHAVRARLRLLRELHVREPLPKKWHSLQRLPGKLKQTTSAPWAPALLPGEQVHQQPHNIFKNKQIQ